MDSALLNIPVQAFRKHSLRAFATVLGIVTLLAGCGGGSGESGSFSPNTPASPGGELPAGDEPAVVFNESSFLLTTNETRLYKLSPVTGRSEEIITFGGGIEFVEPLDVIGDTVYSTADDNTINAIDLETGELLWDVLLGKAYFSEYPSGVVCDSETCWARGSTGVMMAVSATDGTVKWSRPLHPNGAGNENELNGSDLLVTSDRIYQSIYKHGTSLFPDVVEPSFIVIDRNDGSIIKQMDLEYTAYGVPSVIGDTLLISTWGEVLAYGKNSFELLWRINDPAHVYTTATVVGNVFAVGVSDANDHYIVGFDLNSGQQLWAVPAGSSDNAYSSTTDGTLVYAMVGERDTSTYYTPPGEAAMAINPADGSIVWIKDGLSFARNPLVAFGHAYYGFYWDVLDEQANRNPDGLTSVNARTGDVEWVNSRLDTPGVDWFTTTPVLVHEGVSYRTSFYPDVMP